MRFPRSLFLVRRALHLLDRRGRKLYGVAVTIQMLTSFLDLLAIALIGLVVAGATSLTPGDSASPSGGLLESWIPNSATGIVLLAVLGGLLLVTKSVASLYLTRRTYRFLANRSAMVSSRCADQLLSLSLLKIQRYSSQRIVHGLTTGVTAAVINTLGSSSVILTEASLIVLLLLGLSVADPVIAVYTLVFFGLIAALLQLVVGRWSVRLGRDHSGAAIGSMVELQHAIRAYRELVVANRRNFFVRRFEALRWKAASVFADAFILSQAGKYVFEIALVLGGGGLLLILGATRSIEESLVSLSVFIVVATRVFPSLMRLQGSFAQLRSSEGISEDLFELLADLPETQQNSHTATLEDLEDHKPKFDPSVGLENVTLLYPGTSQPALRDISLRIKAGQFVALVGSTGAGKSTLADIMLGVIDPTSGIAHLSSLPPEKAIQKWPGSISYVPQDVAVLSGSIRENVALGLPKEEIEDGAVWDALQRAHLSDFLTSHRDGLDTVVGENGVMLSGGQRQRLGIARALYSRPGLLVMDEATSALDSQTERDIASTINEMSGEVTTIVIAHRLATVRNCDLVVYLEQGRLVASGSFQDVRRQVPAFDQQAQLLGL